MFVQYRPLQGNCMAAISKNKSKTEFKFQSKKDCRDHSSGPEYLLVNFKLLLWLFIVKGVILPTLFLLISNKTSENEK